jgi:hypothetical protein
MKKSKHVLKSSHKVLQQKKNLLKSIGDCSVEVSGEDRREDILSLDLNSVLHSLRLRWAKYDRVNI